MFYVLLHILSPVVLQSHPSIILRLCYWSCWWLVISLATLPTPPPPSWHSNTSKRPFSLLPSSSIHSHVSILSIVDEYPVHTLSFSLSLRLFPCTVHNVQHAQNHTAPHPHQRRGYSTRRGWWWFVTTKQCNQQQRIGGIIISIKLLPGYTFAQTNLINDILLKLISR